MERTFEPAGRPRVPRDTPAEVAEAIGWEAREPVPVERADLGHPFVLPALPTTPPHRLVVIGDSISHGFKSFAVAETMRSWPALVAGAAGMTFEYPEYPGPPECPGLPLNLEATVRYLQQTIPGSILNIAGDLAVGVKLRSLMARWRTTGSAAKAHAWSRTRLVARASTTSRSGGGTSETR